MLTGASDGQTISCLIEACRDEADFVRHLAIGSLLSTSEPSRFETLTSFLTDSSPLCRETAVKLTLELNSDTSKPVTGAPTVSESVTDVASLLQDEEPTVRKAVLEALIQLQKIAAEEVGGYAASIRHLAVTDSQANNRNLANRLLRLMGK